MIIRQLSILGLTLGLSGCVSLLPDPKPPSSVYRLSYNAAPVEAAFNAEVIRVDRPAATKIFSTNNIVVTDDSRKLSVVALAKWSETTPVMVQSSMVDALAASPKFVGLIPTSGARSETRLHLSILNFEAKFDGGFEKAPIAVVNYRVTYSDADDRKLLGTHTFERTVRADSIEVPSIVDALESANQAAMTDIVSWLDGQSRTGSI